MSGTGPAWIPSTGHQCPEALCSRLHVDTREEVVDRFQNKLASLPPMTALGLAKDSAADTVDPRAKLLRPAPNSHGVAQQRMCSVDASVVPLVPTEERLRMLEQSHSNSTDYCRPTLTDRTCCVVPLAPRASYESRGGAHDDADTLESVAASDESWGSLEDVNLPQRAPFGGCSRAPRIALAIQSMRLSSDDAAQVGPKVHQSTWEFLQPPVFVATVHALLPMVPWALFLEWMARSRLLGRDAPKTRIARLLKAVLLWGEARGEDHV